MEIFHCNRLYHTDMNKYNRIFLSIIILLGFCSCEQTDSNTKTVINEVLTNNVGNFQDDYGTHNAWIEIFNKSYGSVDLAGYQLKVSSQPGDTMTYYIPKGDVLTAIKPRQHALFWADGKPSRGTFHTSCVLDTLKSNWVGLYDSGSKLVDEVIVPALGKDLSYARVRDASEKWEIKGTDDKHYVTPSTNNQTIERNEKVEKFQEQDKSGIGMSISAMTVVFSGLLVLYILFRCMGKAAVSLSQRVKDKSNQKFVEKLNMKKEEQGNKAAGECNDEVYAAIAMALHESSGTVHDVEKQVLTIRRTNSPWNNKWSALRVIPQKK